MTSRISHTTIDSRDAYTQSVWWGHVLGFTECAIERYANDRLATALTSHVLKVRRAECTAQWAYYVPLTVIEAMRTVGAPAVPRMSQSSPMAFCPRSDALR